MLSTSVIILLREVLEAVLILSLFMASAQRSGLNNRWLLPAIGIGLLASIGYASQLSTIANLFDGVGQEIFDAFSLILLSVLLPLTMYGHFIRVKENSRPAGKLYALMIGVTIIAIAREGAEIYLYLSAFIPSPELRNSLFAGSAIGVGLGFSVGALFYFWLGSFKEQYGLRINAIIASLIAAGMILQACKMLIQADWLPDGQVWDSSGLIAEDSVLGQLMYALIGYEASPAPVQIAAYFIVLLSSLAFLFSGLYQSRTKAEKDVNHPQARNNHAA
ncbi:FTR1 family protein [Spongiibacter sp. KMU-158]|uniref:FTR1 family protein n=1 Tax=Spongiibacter pelagi TaxID=2760804 RepID=A0A927GWE6_9GAMM|nr:FTR1 family protein [Spongiibacter pelagi]MBD2858349.1 FTR1 family protein [Spongiibacter pelagi]